MSNKKVLPKKIAIYVPQWNGEWTLKVTEKMSEWFGGCTALRSVGTCYVNGSYIDDEVMVVYSFTTGEGMLATDGKVRELALEVGKALSQSSIAVEISGKMELLEIE